VRRYCSAVTSAPELPVSYFTIVVVVVLGVGAVGAVGATVVEVAGAALVGPGAAGVVPRASPQPEIVAAQSSAKGTTIHRSRRRTIATIMML
jgi:hypothetical protein